MFAFSISVWHGVFIGVDCSVILIFESPSLSRLCCKRRAATVWSIITLNTHVILFLCSEYLRMMRQQSRWFSYIRHLATLSSLDLRYMQITCLQTYTILIHFVVRGEIQNPCPLFLRIMQIISTADGNTNKKGKTF